MARRLAAAVGVSLLLLCSTLAVADDSVPDIFTAARLGDVETLAAVLAEDPDAVHHRDAGGATTLHYAAAGGQVTVVHWLVAAGADASAADNSGRTPLHVAAQHDDAGLIDALVAGGADVHAADAGGRTALHVAARHFRPVAVDALLADGADPMARDSQGRTPLHVLGAARRVEDAPFFAVLDGIAAALVAAGADPAIVAEGYPALADSPAEDGGPPVRDTWTSYSDIGPTLLAYEAAYPGLARRYDLGLSVQGRHLWAIRISDNVDLEEDEPEFRYVSSLHGDEIVGVKLCMLLIDHLLTNYGDPNEPLVNTLVDEVEIWIVPLANPDGYDRASRTRYNAQGVDLNRDFPEGAPSNPDPDTTDGRAPETAVLMNWSTAQSFTASANFHGGALVANYPFDNDGTGSRYTPDQDLFVYMAEEYSRHNLPMWNGDWYHGITNGVDWYRVQGGLQDWSYRYRGCNDITIELADSKQPSAGLIPTLWNDNRDAMLAYMATCLIGVRGVVTDAVSGAPLAAAVQVVGRNHDVYTDPDVGDYHRMLRPGAYALRFTAEGYEEVTLPATVAEGPATRLDVQLAPGPEVVHLTYPLGDEVLDANAPVEITWVGHEEAQFHVQHTANFGAVAGEVDGFEGGVLGGEYVTGGAAVWFVTDSDAQAGTYSARAGVISHGRTTYLTRVIEGPAEVAFWYRVSSEAKYDWFNFYVDGVRLVHVAGDVGWTSFAVPLDAGAHTLKWEYTKDYSQSVGSDTVWIDEVAVTRDETVWEDVVALTDAGATGVTWMPAAVSAACKVRVRAYVDDAYGAWSESAETFEVRAAAAGRPGDLNCDGQVDFFDIDPLLVALRGAAEYEARYPDCRWLNGDCNTDGTVDFFDIDGFLARLGT